MDGFGSDGRFQNAGLGNVGEGWERVMAGNCCGRRGCDGGNVIVM